MGVLHPSTPRMFLVAFPLMDNVVLTTLIPNVLSSYGSDVRTAKVPLSTTLDVS